MNMDRAGVVNHPAQWKVSGFKEIQKPPPRYRIIDQQALIDFDNFQDAAALRHRH